MDDLPPIRGTSPIADVGVPPVMMPAIFLSGCNFRCPYCINRELVIGNGLPELDPCQVFADLMLSGERWVMISGAEPLSDRRTPRLLEVAKSNFLKVALATNGSHYDALKGVIYSGLVDHVVMDVKTSLDIDRYREVTGIPMSEQVFGNIVKSVKLLSEVTVPVDFRMTMCSKFVGFEDLRALAEVAGIGSNVVLQPYRIHQTLLPSLASPSYQIPYETLVEWRDRIRPLVRAAVIREV